LYAFTFSTYLGSILPFKNSYWSDKLIAGSVILFFAIINIVSVKGIGKIEDWMVYSKLETVARSATN
jgi:amino acid transporter